MNEKQNIETAEQETPEQLAATQSVIVNPTQENISETPKDFVNISKEPNESIEIEEKLPHLKPRLKKLIEYILIGTPRIEAHKNAGFKGKNDESRAQLVAQYLQKDKVRQYIEIRERQINADLRAKSLVTRESLSGEYQLIIDECKQNKDVTWKRLQRETIDSQAKLHGLSIDRIKVDQPMVFPEIQSIPKDKRRELIAQLEDKLPVKVN